MSDSTLTQMRTIPQLVAEAKKEDPQTALTERGLRRLVKDGKIPYIKIGAKVLINVAAFQKFLYQGENTLLIDESEVAVGKGDNLWPVQKMN